MGVRNHTATHAPPPEKRIFGSGIFDTYLEKSDMAQWSQKAIDARVAEKNVEILAERMDLFKKFRDGGWQIEVLDPTSRSFVRQRDGWFRPGIGAHFLVKMPGAHAMRIRTVDQLRRLVRGVA
jgi:hypothetical protein